MTDINKQIEEARECRRKLIQKIRLNKANIDYILENGSINGSLMLDIDKAMIDYHAHSSRWRKVSEELPEVKDENFFINIKRYDNEFRIDTICVFAEMEDVKGYLEFNNVDSWKPID